jgi:hypothetical protein
MWSEQSELLTLQFWETSVKVHHCRTLELQIKKIVGLQAFVLQMFCVHCSVHESGYFDELTDLFCLRDWLRKGP